MSIEININGMMEDSWNAFLIYSKLPATVRSAFLKTIAAELEANRTELVSVCMQESHLPETRLQGELSRTIFQLNSYADAAVRGDYLNAVIDTALPDRTPVPKPDIRKTSVPLGPVLVFGASNFPFAFSTAGGDTASAFASGCSVLVKAHSAHPKTSALAAAAIQSAIHKNNLPKGLFQHIESSDKNFIHKFITHHYLKAIGFTGSFTGGKAIWELANSRKEPIPVYAEMSSINPIFILPEKAKENDTQLAQQIAGSVTLGAGQFCTNPGLIIAIDNEATQKFINELSAAIAMVKPSHMLHKGIAANFRKNREIVLQQSGVALIKESNDIATDLQDIPSIAQTTAKAFVSNNFLSTEVFGSFSLVVLCDDVNEMKSIAKKMEGQLTSSIMATTNEMAMQKDLIDEISLHCGRIIFNQVPTGVEVCQAMNHGGPWPSTSNANYTSVGADAIKRFVRPLTFQNWPDELLPDELKNNNPLQIFRTTNNQLTKEPLQ